VLYPSVTDPPRKMILIGLFVSTLLLTMNESDVVEVEDDLPFSRVASSHRET